jgi:hypothetical protein
MALTTLPCATALACDDSFLLSTDVINSLLLHSCCGDTCVRATRRTSDDNEDKGSSEDGADHEESDNVTTQGSSGRGSVGIGSDVVDAATNADDDVTTDATMSSS